MNATQDTPERWLPVPGWEGSYSVSDHGNVRSEARVIRSGDGVRSIPSRLLTPAAKMRTGHLWVGLCRNSSRTHASIHHLVLEAFVGPRPDGLIGRHLDDDPKNNHVTNLAWGTVAENNRDTVRNGHHRDAIKTHCIRGHEFFDWNLTAYSKTIGRRFCLSCKNARERIRYRGGVGDMQELSDRYFAELRNAAEASR